LIVRLLVLPGLADEAISNLKWLASELSNEVSISLMSQYTPAYKAHDVPPFDRSVEKDEYEKVVDAACDLGFENGWIQAYESSNPDIALLGENMSEDYGIVRR
jgi:putative pyruvate formate lyase activating enzyme